MAKAKDFGERVRDRLRALGYVKNGRLDVNGFSVEKGYIPSYVYRWAKGEVPRGPALLRFARDLKASPEELLGPPPPPPRRMPHPIAGASDGPLTPLLAKCAEIRGIMSTMRRALRMWFQAWAQPLLSHGVYA